MTGLVAPTSFILRYNFEKSEGGDNHPMRLFYLLKRIFQRGQRDFQEILRWHCFSMGFPGFTSTVGNKGFALGDELLQLCKHDYCFKAAHLSTRAFSVSAVANYPNRAKSCQEAEEGTKLCVSKEENVRRPPRPYPERTEGNQVTSL